jgi:hypothetical protein
MEPFQITQSLRLVVQKDAVALEEHKETHKPCKWKQIRKWNRPLSRLRANHLRYEYGIPMEMWELIQKPAYVKPLKELGE